MTSIVSNQVVVGVVVAFTTSAVYHSRKVNGNLCMDPKLSALVLGVNHGSAQKNTQSTMQVTSEAINTKGAEFANKYVGNS